MPLRCMCVNLDAASFVHAAHAPTWPSLDSILILGLGHCSEVTPRRLQAAGEQCRVVAHLGFETECTAVNKALHTYTHAALPIITSQVHPYLTSRLS